VLGQRRHKHKTHPNEQVQLSHDKTKVDPTNYLAAKILEYNSVSHKLVITSSSGHTRSNKDLLFQDNNHEEADTLLIYRAVLAS